jgi:hypothetical protein
LPYHTEVPAGPPTPVVVRLAAEWDCPAARAFCAAIEAAAIHAPAAAVIHHGRNLIFRALVGNDEVAVKCFPVAGARRVVYRVRTSKAARAFDNAVRLRALGVGTPCPLAAVELWRGASPLASFYCCALLPAFREARELKRDDAGDRATLLSRLGEFVGGLHESRVLHRDLTSGNVLIVPDPEGAGGVTFQLVDINRMRFGPVGVLRGLANLAQLRLHDGGAVLGGYCRARKLAVAGVARRYRVFLSLRSLRQTVQDRTRPVRRRLGL